MKKLMITLLAGMLSLLAFSQTFPIDSKNSKHTGQHWFTRDLNIMGSTLNKTKIDAYDKSIGDTLKASDYLVFLKDTINNAPGNYMTRQNHIYDPVNPMILNILNLNGAGIKIFPFTSVYWGNGTAMNDGTIKYSLYYIPEKMTITGVKYMLSVQGVYTADNTNSIGLYSISGTTFTKVAETANDGTLWSQATSTVLSKAFSAPYVANPGFYYVACLYNSSAQTTAPSIFYSDQVGTFINIIGTNMIIGQTTSKTSLPTSEVKESLTGSSSGGYFMLY